MLSLIYTKQLCPYSFSEILIDAFSCFSMLFITSHLWMLAKFSTKKNSCYQVTGFIACGSNALKTYFLPNLAVAFFFHPSQ